MTTEPVITVAAAGELDLELWRRGKVFYTADPHLGHERIIELCNRPFADVGEMNEAILDGINSEVGGRNTLVILGDIVLGKFEETLKLLKQIHAAKVLLIPGNHDRFSLAYGHKGALETQRLRRRLWMIEYENLRRNASIRCVEDRERSAWLSKVAGQPVLLSHYPYVGDSQSGAGGKDRHQHLRPLDQGLPLIHGHVHGLWRARGRMLNVGVDVNGFKPVSEFEIADWLSGLPMGGVRGVDMPAAG
jgi:calcineurin-like phosphoesterase family protein